jgi:hypothetical protein
MCSRKPAEVKFTANFGFTRPNTGNCTSTHRNRLCQWHMWPKMRRFGVVLADTLWRRRYPTRGRNHRVIPNDDGDRPSSRLSSACRSELFRLESIVGRFRGAFLAAPGFAVALMYGTAWAQNAPSEAAVAPPGPDAVRPSPLPAPVGHRQPRPSDLPPAPAGDDARAQGAVKDDINDKLRICRGC